MTRIVGAWKELNKLLSGSFDDPNYQKNVNLT